MNLFFQEFPARSSWHDLSVLFIDIDNTAERNGMYCMMNYIWAGMLIVSILCGFATGRTSEVTEAMFSGASDAVTLVISLLGSMCLWSGLMAVAEHAGITRQLAKLFSPLLRLLFPTLKRDSPAARAISMNISANLLGMGNAATPLGITAMKELAKDSRTPGIADERMITFVVMNTACLQLIPSTIAVIRSNFGCRTPFDIIPPIVISSLTALTAGLVLVKLLGRRKRGLE